MLKDCPQNLTVALEASLLGQLFIFQTIFQPWALSSDIPAAERGSFTNYHHKKLTKPTFGCWPFGRAKVKRQTFGTSAS